MNHYTELLNYIKEVAEGGNYINTVTQGDLDEAYVNKSDIYPLLHISIDNGSFSNGQTIIFDVVLECVSVRDENKNEVNDDKFWNNNNEVDNYNETLAELNRIWTILYGNFNENDITASENPSLEKISGEKGNILDGWGLNFKVEMPNTTLNLCT